MNYLVACWEPQDFWTNKPADLFPYQADDADQAALFHLLNNQIDAPRMFIVLSENTKTTFQDALVVDGSLTYSNDKRQDEPANHFSDAWNVALWNLHKKDGSFQWGDKSVHWEHNTWSFRPRLIDEATEQEILPLFEEKGFLSPYPTSCSSSENQK